MPSSLHLSREVTAISYTHQGSHSAADRSTIVRFTVGIFLFWAAMYVYTPVFPVYAGVLGASMSTVGLAVGAYGLTQMILRIPLGVWSDSLGKRHVFVLAGMFICGMAAVGFAFSPTPSWLVFFRGVMGVAAATWVCSTVLFTSYFPKTHPSVPLSIMTFAASAGQLVGVFSGGELAQRLGWVAPFWASLTLSLVGAVVIWRAPEDVTARAMPITRQGILRTLSSPSLITACILGVLMQYVAWATTNAFVPVLAAERFQATRAHLGYLTTIGLVAYTLVTLLTPRLVRMVGEAPPLVLSVLFLAAGTVITPWVSNLGELAVLQAITGVGRGLIYPLLLSLSIKTTAPQDRAAAMGIYQATYALGMFVGPAFSGTLAEALGLDAVFILCGALCLLCLPIIAVAAPRAMARQQA